MPNIARNAPQNGTKTRKVTRPQNPSTAKPTPRVPVADSKVRTTIHAKPERGTSYPWR